MQQTLSAGDPAPDFTLSDIDPRGTIRAVWNKVKAHAETVHGALCRLT